MTGFPSADEVDDAGRDMLALMRAIGSDDTAAEDAILDNADLRALCHTLAGGLHGALAIMARAAVGPDGDTAAYLDGLLRQALQSA